jgi:hypothetical protein
MIAYSFFSIVKFLDGIAVKVTNAILRFLVLTKKNPSDVFAHHTDRDELRARENGH